MEEMKIIEYKNMTKNKELIDYFNPEKNGENKSIWLESQVTLKEVSGKYNFSYILKDSEEPERILDNPYKKFVVKK